MVSMAYAECDERDAISGNCLGEGVGAYIIRICRAGMVALVTGSLLGCLLSVGIDSKSIDRQSLN